jgi:TolA-binding protein
VQLEADFADDTAPSDRPPPPPPPRRRRRIAAFGIAAVVACTVAAPIFEPPAPETAPIAAHVELARGDKRLARDRERLAGSECRRATCTPADRRHPASVATPPPGEATTASTAFEAANRARRDGAYDDALRLYGALLERYPASAEAQTSQLILGRLLLDRGDASGALAAFDACLAQPGADRHEEPLTGRALALERLGRPESRDAWRALIRRFPLSPYVPHAVAQLARAPGDSSF